ncbi:glycosyltransferase, partial [Bacteroides congonensis]
MAILEAAQYGKPTIGPDHGGFTEIIGKGGDAIGVLFRPGDVDDMEDRIVELWNNPSEVNALGKKAFEKLQNEYSSEVIYQKWESLFNELLIR